jgi:phosphatidate cytidylyltransferase
MTAMMGIPLIVATIFVGGWWYVAVAALIALLAGWEYSRLLAARGYQINRLLCGGLILLLLLHSHNPDLRFLDLLLSLAIVLSLSWQLFRADSTIPAVDWALTLAGGVYIGWSMGRLVALRQLADGVAWVSLVIFSTWGTDTAAYLVGKALGRHPLWPRLSPKKTWEGLGGSVAGALLGATVVALFFGVPGWPTVLVVGLVTPVVGLFGDLSVSMLKRSVGAKDTSTLIPGHGGFLDRLDSIFFVAIFIYHYAIWVGQGS